MRKQINNQSTILSKRIDDIFSPSLNRKIYSVLYDKIWFIVMYKGDFEYYVSKYLKWVFK